MVHELKVQPIYFEQQIRGLKSFELRKDDRDYDAGDYLFLREYYNEKYTGREVMLKVTSVLRNAKEFGLKRGYVILSTKILKQ